MQLKHILRNARENGLVLSLIATLSLAGCGGSSGGNNNNNGNGPGANTIAGTAATGVPIVGQVVAIDKNGNKFFATSSATGAYTVDVAGPPAGVAPFILSITGMAGGKAVTLNSVATGAGQTVNITPLTDLIVSTAAGQPGGAALATLCASADQTACKAALTAATTGTNLSAAVTAVTNMIHPLNLTDINPLTGPLTAGSGAGMDAVLDAILVTPAPDQGAMATVTLISVPGQQLGTVTLPATAGGTATSSTVTPPPSSLTDAAKATTALAEIRTCLASFNALYPASMTTPPTATQVSPFLDTTFTLGGGDQAGWVWMFTHKATADAGTNGGFAIPGLTITAAGFSPFDFTAQPSGTLLTTTPALSSTTAWVGINIGGTSNGGFGNFKMIKGTAYAGCPGGWKMAGTGHIEVHMHARISKNAMGGTPTYSRQLPLHVNTTVAEAAGIGSIKVHGPGLSAYDSAKATGVGTATDITLVTPAVPTPPTVQPPTMQIQGAQVGWDEAIPSCQDLRLDGSSLTGTPCYDDTAVAPGAVYTYTAYDGADPNTAAVLYAFPFQINAVPLSRAFAQANDKDLFAQNITVTPGSIGALYPATAGAPLDGIIKLSYTQSNVYGAVTNNCGVGFNDASGTIFQAEQNADGLPTQQTSCTFTTAGLNSGSLAVPAVMFAGDGYVNVGNKVLGNQAGSIQPFAAGVAPAQNQNIVGSWYGLTQLGAPDTTAILTFFADGTYMQSQSVSYGAGQWPGVEQGTYTWDSNLALFSTGGCPVVENNGDAGLSNATTAGTGVCGATMGTVTVNGNTATFRYNEGNVPTTLTLYRVVNATNPGVGTWTNMKVNGVSALTGNSLIYTFFANGDYMQSQSVAAGTAIGLEYGTFTLNPANGAFAAACPTVDTNGAGGVSNATGTSCTAGTTAMNATVTVSGNTLSVAVPGTTYTFDRVMP